jgi:hypothetical protein
MPEAKGVRQVGYYDSIGGGQVVVEKGFAYIAHMKAPHGTSVVDVRDPKNPKQVATVEIPEEIHSHKVRVGDGIMLVNHERMVDGDAGMPGGLGIYDIANPAAPKLIHKWAVPGKGVHRFDFDGRYFYGSATQKGYRGTIVMILDLADPANPREVGRWHMEGQHIEGGETPTWQGAEHRCHHPLRFGDRLYVSYWHGGFVILDISDMSKPKRISGLDWSPPFTCPTHSAVLVPFPLQNRRVALVADEDVAKIGVGPPAFLWFVDVTDEARPTPFASFQLEHLDGREQPPMTGCHQPIERITGNEVPVAWFANGLRIVDISKPHAPKEAACFVPDVPQGSRRVSSNDVFVDDRGLIYLIDRVRGLHILERT